MIRNLIFIGERRVLFCSLSGGKNSSLYAALVPQYADQIRANEGKYVLFEGMTDTPVSTTESDRIKSVIEKAIESLVFLN